ncbi:MAG: peptidylprolyl isomerase [Oscillospiraceae bacterium]|nr:peptidylprolyl isomerase [Oscillospiraceae bacterium]
MNRKKIVSLVLCAVLALGVLAGSASASDAATQAVLDRAGAAYDADTVVCTIDGEPVTWPLYFYLLSEELRTVTYYTGALPTDYNEMITEDMTTAEYIAEMALYKAKYYTSAHTRAVEAGVALDEAGLAALEDDWAQMEERYGGPEEFQKLLDEAHLTKPVFLYLIQCSQELEALMGSAYGTQGEKLSPKDVLDWAEDGGYIRVKHILYFFYDDAGQPLDDAGKEAQRLRAEASLAELKALLGDNEALEARFDEIMNQDSGDVGGLSQFPQGYTFTSGTMYPEFEEAAFDMEEFALSELVESQSGYHIILRLPLDTEGMTMDQDANTGAHLTLRQSAANDLFSLDLADWIQNAQVEWTPGFEKLDLGALFDATDLPVPTETPAPTAAPTAEPTASPAEAPADEPAPAEKEADAQQAAEKRLDLLYVGLSAVLIAFTVLMVLPEKPAKKKDAPKENND